MSTVERPLRRDAERNRQLIIEAASALFAERGLSVTLDDVARRAGLGVGTVYRRFRSRDELIEALFVERMGDIVRLADEALECPDPWEGLLMFLRGALEMQTADRGLKELLLGSSTGRTHVSRMREQMRPRGAELVRRAKEVGALREDFAPQDLPLLQMMLGAVIDATEPVRPDLWRRYFALVTAGMRAEAADEALPVGPVAFSEMESVMSCWRPPTPERPRPPA